MNEQQKIQYIAHTISPTILNSIITNVFSFFLNTCQRSTEYLSRAKGKKSPVLASLVRYFLPFALDKYSVRSFLNGFKAANGGDLRMVGSGKLSV